MLYVEFPKKEINFESTVSIFVIDIAVLIAKHAELSLVIIYSVYAFHLK
jgi:hypothetical protein